MAASWCGRGLLRRPLLCAGSRRYGYIVLVPEIGEGVSEKENPFFHVTGLPEFNTFTIENCIAAISTQAAGFENGVRNIEKTLPKTKNIFADVFTPLEQLESPLELSWGLAKTLYMGNSSVMPTKSYLQIHERAHRARVTKFHSVPIYEAVLNASKNKKSIKDEENRLLQKYSREGQLNGLGLDKKKKEKFISILHEINFNQKQFRDKNVVASKIFSHTITNPTIVSKFPSSLLKNMATDINEPTRGPWKVSLQPNVYEPFMEYCPNKTLRWNAWQSYVRRSSSFTDKSVDTSVNLERIRDFRLHQANLLGFKTYADMSMETKMAGSVSNVQNFIAGLLERARTTQDVEIEKLEDFARENGLEGPLEPCDIEYWKREHRKTLFSYDEEETRDYFPLPTVMEGLIDLCSKLFDIKIIERPKTNVWHEDVIYFDVFDSSSASPIAGFYLDPYAREDEKVRVPDNSAWIITMRNRSTITGAQPLAALIFNFQIPLYGKPSLLSFQEVKLLFHKFGHALQHLLTESNYSDVAGVSNIEWDAAAVCGHVLTHWLYEPSVLKSISRHYATEEALPEDMIENFNNIRRHMAGYDLCKELYISDLDLQFYSTKTFWRDVVVNLWPKYHSLPHDKQDSQPCTMTKIMADQWSAAYYCDLWSRMLAADIYGAFHEAKQDEEKISEIGRRYRDTFLATGGACHSSEVFRRFRGRDPSHKALLYVLGLKKPVTSVQK